MNPESMEARVARMEEQVKSHENTIRAVAALPVEMAKAVTRLDDAVTDIAEIRDTLRQRVMSKTSIVVALIGASAIVLAAVITVLVNLAAHHA